MRASVDLRVIPRSPRDAVDGWRDGRLVVRVTAPPVDHAANEAVVAVLARALDERPRTVLLDESDIKFRYDQQTVTNR